MYFRQQNGFDDPWRDQKRLANLTSLKILKPRLECIDNIQNPDERWIELFRGILAGIRCTSLESSHKNDKCFL